MKLIFCYTIGIGLLCNIVKNFNFLLYEQNAVDWEGYRDRRKLANKLPTQESVNSHVPPGCYSKNNDAAKQDVIHIEDKSLTVL